MKSDTTTTTLTQAEVNQIGAAEWAAGSTRANCDQVLLTAGATAVQIEQFHLAFDLTHTWPAPPAATAKPAHHKGAGAGDIGTHVTCTFD